MRNVWIGYGVALALVLYGCKGKEPEPAAPKMGKLYISIKDRGSYLADSLLKRVRISYNNNGAIETDHSLDRSSRFDALFRQQEHMQRVTDLSALYIPGLLSSSDIPQVIDRYGITEFHLIYADGSSDTLLIEMDEVGEAEADLERCHCIYPIRSITYRGQKAKEDTDIHPELVADPPVFLIEKR